MAFKISGSDLGEKVVVGLEENVEVSLTVSMYEFCECINEGTSAAESC
jgi:hypothetical protein